MDKTLLFLLGMVLITVVPLILILLVVMAMKSWMSPRKEDSPSEDVTGPTPEGR